MERGVEDTGYGRDVKGMKEKQENEEAIRKKQSTEKK
jgi:hypothetical protein